MFVLVAQIIARTPSIQAAIATGEYTMEQAVAEFADQIKMGDAANGLLLLDDLPEDLREAIA